MRREEASHVEPVVKGHSHRFGRSERSKMMLLDPSLSAQKVCGLAGYQAVAHQQVGSHRIPQSGRDCEEGEGKAWVDEHGCEHPQRHRQFMGGAGVALLSSPCAMMSSGGWGRMLAAAT